MIESIGPIGSSSHSQLRLMSGVNLLEEWSATARQLEKNALYRALFAIADRSVFATYDIIDDARRPREFVVVVADDLVIKIHVHGFDTFGIAYLGSIGDTGGDVGIGAADPP